MRVLGREQITATPQSQAFVAGVAVLTPGTPTTFWGSVQPIGQHMIERLPEGARRSARWIIFAENPTPALSMTPPADRLTTSKGVLIPIADIDFSTHTTGLPHVAYACAEVGETDNV